MRYLTVALLVAVGIGFAQYLEATIQVGAGPEGVLWNPLVNKVYVANFGSDNVTIINGANNEVISTITVGRGPSYLTWNSRANKVYVSSEEGNTVSVIDGFGDTLIRDIYVPGWPDRMAYCESVNKLYVDCVDDEMVRGFDAGPDTLIATIPIRDLYGIEISHPVTNRLFCRAVWGGQDILVVIDCVTDRIVNKLQLGTAGYNLGASCYNPVNNLIYVGYNYTVFVLSPNGDSIVAAIPTAAFSPVSLCFVPFPNKIYVLDCSGVVTVIDCNTNTVIDTIRTQENGYELCCDTVRGKVYCLSRYTAYIFDARADTLIKMIPVGRASGRICWNRTDSRVYIPDNRNGVVYVIRDTCTGVGEERIETLLNREISALPNPFRNRVLIRYSLPNEGQVTLRVYNTAGQLIRTLVNRRTRAGNYSVTWDGKDEKGGVCAAGVYSFILETEAGRVSRRLVLVR